MRSLHEDYGRSLHSDVTRGSNRNFGLVITIIFLVVAVAPVLHHGLGVLRVWALMVALAILTIALLAPSALSPINKLWFALGILLSKITTPILMGILFFGVLTPFSLITRLTGMVGRSNARADSYWVARQEVGPPPQTMTRQF
jgi:Saxitoxin biosynthesis operon protein SxtJ